LIIVKGNRQEESILEGNDMRKLVIGAHEGEQTVGDTAAGPMSVDDDEGEVDSI
jgi:hypothetical protein